MAMLEGVIEINPLTGATVVKTGCAGVVFDAMEAGQNYGNLAASNPVAYAEAREQIANLARAVAKVIPYIVSNADVNVTVPAGVAVQVTPASGTGATTAPGNGTGGVT